jgi:CheY-like chemotaxis protein
MKKVLLAQDLQEYFQQGNSFIEREDIVVFSAATNDDILQIHRWEAVDLIISRLDLPGMSMEELFAFIKQSGELNTVGAFIICRNTPDNRDRCKQCGVNAIFSLPDEAKRLNAHVQHFLNIAPRTGRRAALTLDIQGMYRDRELPFRTKNISSRGMLISSDEPLLKGDGISFSFSLPDNTPVSGFGRIMRDAQAASAADSYHYGVKFTVIEPSVRDAIESVVNA